MLSISQVKKFMKSKAQWAGEYILWLKDERKDDSLYIGSAFHKVLELYNLNWKRDDNAWHDILSSCEDKEKAIEVYDCLINNIKKIDNLERWEQEVKVNFKLFWADFLWFIDCLTSDCVIDYKTVSSLSKEDSNPWFRQAENNYADYKFQLRAYAKATNRRKWKIIEIMKKTLKTRPDERGQVIEFEFDEQTDKEMEEKYWGVVKEMVDLLEKHKNINATNA